MITYQKAYFRGKGIGIAIADGEGLYQFFGKGYTELATTKELELFPNSEHTSTSEHVERIIHILNKLA